MIGYGTVKAKKKKKGYYEWLGVLPLCQEFLSNVSREPVKLVLVSIIGLCGLASLSSQKAFLDFKSGIFLRIGAMKLKLFGIFF